MKIEKLLDKYKGAAVLVILAIIILTPVAYYVVQAAIPQTVEPFLEMPDPKYKECVRDTDYMRLYHMDLLKEIRIQVVREGKRNEIRFDDCRECHVNRNRFCNQCHNIVNLNLDCFGCHNYPESAQEALHSAQSQLNLSAIPTPPRPGS